MTPHKIDTLAEALANETIAPDDVPWDTFTEAERREVLVLTAYAIRRRAWLAQGNTAAQRRARNLLRSLLTREQRRQLRNGRGFVVRGSAGGAYRLFPETGAAHRLERHGTRWYGVVRYCLHDARDGSPEVMPPADVTIGQMLLLRTDEPAFLATANATPDRPMGWNGDWRRRLNAARRARRQEEAA